MINTLIDELDIWLVQYSKNQSTPDKLKRTSTLLLSKLNKIKTLEQLFVLLDSIQPTLLDRSSTNAFETKRTGIIATIRELQVCQSQVIGKLNFGGVRAASFGQAEDFISLLNEVLVDTNYLLHVQALALLKQLNALESLQNIINHLAVQPLVTCPEKPSPGSFNAVIPLNKMHASCLSLLRNNCVTFDLRNPLSTQSNQILQRLLIVYQDIQMPSSDPKEEPPSCVMS